MLFIYWITLSGFNMIILYLSLSFYSGWLRLFLNLTPCPLSWKERGTIIRRGALAPLLPLPFIREGGLGG